MAGEATFPREAVEFKEISDMNKWSDYWKNFKDKNGKKLKNQSLWILAGNDLVYKKLIGPGEKNETVLQELLGEVPYAEGKKKGRLIKQKSGTVLAVVMAGEIPESAAEILSRAGLGIRGVFWATAAGISGEEGELTGEQVKAVHNFEPKESWRSEVQSSHEKTSPGWYWGLILSLLIILGVVVWKLVL